jgi:hypothetical protein
VLARLARVLLAAALLAGWQAALVHPLEHLDGSGALVHLSENQDGHPEKSVLCDALAALTACAAQTPLSQPAVPSLDEARFTLRLAVRVADSPPFLAQGPPAPI